jgi:hypothetical protein
MELDFILIFENIHKKNHEVEVLWFWVRFILNIILKKTPYMEVCWFLKILET